VFAIAITLLVINLKVPELADADRLAESLKILSHQFFTYFMTFLVIGMQWADHHSRLGYVERCDRGVLWLNLLCLMSVAFLPFPAAMWDRFPHERVAAVFYMSVITLMLLARASLWRYVTRWHPLVTGELSTSTIHTISLIDFFAIVISMLLVICTYFFPEYSVYLLTAFATVSIFVRLKVASKLYS
jgi:uncharacterized membrane protein